MLVQIGKEQWIEANMVIYVHRRSATKEDPKPATTVFVVGDQRYRTEWSAEKVGTAVMTAQRKMLAGAGE